MTAAAERTTRLHAIGRLRRERLSRRAPDLEERMQMIQDVAARVLDLVDETRAQMADLTTSRTIAAKELRNTLNTYRTALAEASQDALTANKTERAAMATTLHAALDQGRADLADAVDALLSDAQKERTEAGKAAWGARQAFLTTLSADVERIVTEDFR